MNSLVAKLEKRLLPEFRKIADRINQTIPNVWAQAETHSVGLDEHLGHSINISCLFTKDYYTEVDDVALCVNIDYLISTPKIFAYVCWGHPSGYIEAEFPKYIRDSANSSLIISDETLEELYKSLPKLYKGLFRALKRRQPGGEYTK